MNGWIAAQYLCLFVADGVGFERDRRLHRGQRNKLEDMIRDHVPQRAGRVVIAAAKLDAELFGHGDLHMIDIVAVPDRLKNAVAEAEYQNILDRFFAEVMVDAVDLAFLQDL